ncbi:hypothetical protein BGZ70_000122 [Mortierella alpina]|uniref:Uncharacterized protein n=1 Tax=Mortierella alpina TaxID=64518 RepID=A0A9P6IYG5_MORAP|nr:hypothetical protein BGZ70_000122 [Mortierella alpina]
MLKPTPHSHRRTHSYENNTPPPYNQAQDGVYSGQGDNSPTGRRAGKELAPLQDFDDDLLAQVENIHDTDLLRRLLIQKEQERQGLASNLDLAARLGLDLHQQIQRLEVESTSKDENVTLQSKAKHSQELSYQLSNAEYDVRELTGHNRFLQKELDTCRNELKIFRKELDELSEHMSEISAEMMDAKSKVNSVFSDSDTMRLTLEELEARQMKCEGKVVEMMTNTREYAQLLEEAQETIHTLRIESDLEGRAWSSARGPQAAIWDNKTGEHPEVEDQRRQEEANQRSRRSSSQGRSEGTDSFGRHQVNSELMEELDPMFDNEPWSVHPTGASTLGQELGNLNQELNGFSRGLDQELAGFNHGSLASELGDSSRDKRDPSPSMFDNGHHRPVHEDAPVHMATSLPQRLSLSAELHQRLEENNILQTVLSGTARPPWTTSGGAVGISSVLSPLQQSPSSIRDIGRTLSMMTLANQKAASTLGVPGRGTQPGASSSNSTHNDIGKAPAAASSSSSSSGSSNDREVGNTSFSSVASSSDGRRVTLDAQNTLGLKYLLLATSSADLSNVITKTKTSSIPIPSQHHKARSSSSAFAVNAQASLSSSIGKSTAGTRGREGRTRTSSFSTSDAPVARDSVSTPEVEDATPSTKPIPIASNRSNRNSMSAAASWSTL